MRFSPPFLRLSSSLRHPLGLLAACLVFTAVAFAADRPALNFIAMGDWGRDGQFGQKEIGEQMGRTAAEIDSRFVISLGDNFYPDGVASVEDPQWKTSYENIYTAPALETPWYVILGNHDYHRSAEAQLDYTLHSSRWKMPARYYTVTRRIDDATTVQFFFLDTNPFIDGYRANPAKYKGITAQDTTAQLAWLESALAASTAQWKIVCGHHPIVSASEKHGDTKELIATVQPLLKKYGVQIYLNGHEHDMQHLRFEGIDYFCSGAASQTRVTKSDDRTVFSLGETGGFLAVKLTRDAFEGRFIDVHGTVRHTATIPRDRTAAAAAAPAIGAIH